MAEVDENVCEHLGSADTLVMPVDFVLDQESDSELIGQWGELLVKNFLEKIQSQPDSDIVAIEWSNAVSQTGLPYDFIIRRRMVDGAETEVYVEVKSTLSDKKACFEISMQQVMFAEENGAAYHIYRVYSAGNARQVRLAKVENLLAKLKCKQVRLLMVI